MTNNRQKSFILTLVLATFVLLLFIPTVMGTPPAIAYADGETITVQYSSVLDDLQKDDSFDPSKYQSVPSKYNLEVIQLAESVNKELFVYVYQPAGSKVKASSINLSMTVDDDLNFVHYQLKLISKHDTLFKYRIEGFTVKDFKTRDYVISTIYRPFDDRLDSQPENGQTISEIPFEVARQYEFGTDADGTEYVACVDIETITITDKFVGYVEHLIKANMTSGESSLDYFVAFSTDKPIDNLLEADVFYSTQDVVIHEKLNIWQSKWEIKDIDWGHIEEENYSYVKYTQKIQQTTGGRLSKGTYLWDRIQSVDEFVESENINYSYTGIIVNVEIDNSIKNETLEQLKTKQWVLRFAERPCEATLNGLIDMDVAGTYISDVSILRLKFETDGVVYNLGVIDNLQTGSSDSVNSYDTEVDPVIEKKIEKIANTFKEFGQNVKDWFSEHKRDFIIAAIVIVCAILFILIIAIAIKLAPARAIRKQTRALSPPQQRKPNKKNKHTAPHASRKE